MKLIRDRDICQILKDTANRKVIVYGSGIFAHETIRMLDCLDIHVDCCIDTDPDACSRTCAGRPVRDPGYVLQEKGDSFVLIAEQDIRACA